MDRWVQFARFAEFETEHLRMRPFHFSDGQDFFEIASNPQNLVFLFSACSSRAESDYLMVHSFMKNPLGAWALEDKDTHKMIGVIRFENLKERASEAEIGYFINQNFWGRGLATEALQNLVFLSFQEFAFERLSLIVHQENQASGRVAEKAGFRLSKRFKGSDRYSHKIRDYLAYDYQIGDWNNE